MDEDLPDMLKLQGGDSRALEQLMVRHKQAIFSLAYRFTGSTAEAADITEETFVKVYFKAHTYNPKAKVKTWIFTIAANLSRDFLRSSKKRRSTFSMHAEAADGSDYSLSEKLSSNEPSPSKHAESSEQVSRIEAAIQALPYKLRYPFTFCILEAHSYSSCAEILKVSSKTIETRIYRARQLLRLAAHGKSNLE
jgi:RNA polymerase sigma factor (sigma-70 family)